ncbi:helix-turn-helix transcriptional regulator [Dactylosporangium vinaceum]|uniref:Helix-turn-helix domain-containing protein n=1 Tax=Dactylosporangium vinaceum TaxID=53362 RepID=A0ABV5MLK0_9ACTN|nr:helix-turn-helix transcriptional regulator [Dactylosporangium vinaceum]UAB96978.1 helix-turn-helix transcriptional regulator [Dactylosporangium vinaceum]
MDTASVSTTLGALVADRRRALGLSQRELADRICQVSGRTTITRHELSRYERGVRLPGGAMVDVLAESLGVPAAVLAAAVTATLERRGRTATRTP